MPGILLDKRSHGAQKDFNVELASRAKIVPCLLLISVPDDYIICTNIRVNLCENPTRILSFFAYSISGVQIHNLSEGTEVRGFYHFLSI